MPPIRFERDADVVRARAGAAEIALDTSRLALDLGCDGLRATARAGVPATAGPRAVACGEIQSARGRALRIEVQPVPAEGARAGAATSASWRWWLELDEEGAGVTAALSWENRGTAPSRVEALEPLAIVAGDAVEDTVPPSLADLGRVARLDGGFALLGFTTRLHGAGAVDPVADGLAAHCGDGAGLAPGARVESERVWLGIGRSPAALVEGWVERIGADMAARVPGHAIWGVRVRGAAELARHADWLAERGAGAVAVLAPDDRAVPLRALPDRLDELATFAERAATQGLRAGVLLGVDCAAPEPVETGLARLAERGFDAFELEGASTPSPGALRASLAAARRGAGPEPLLALASNADVASVGLADAVTEPDPDPARAARDALLGQRLWRLGAVASARSDASRAAFRTGISVAGLEDWLLLAHDALDLPPAWRADLARVLPPLARPRRALSDPPGLVVPLLGDRVAVLLLGEAVVSLESLGLAGPHHVFDFWAERDLGVATDAVPGATLEPGGCRLLALTPCAERPQVIGSTLHVGMGTREAASVRREADGGLRVVLRASGRHAGSIWVAPGGDEPVRRAAVAFRDAATIQL